ncbi:MAG: hypothetical protein VR72_08390 [Clostridiaceae bacterium BRH_c20a]|nr:MAG: hypothetical protein VR72_08390 [Clostridiaceae bacterium BRH_c20a]
MKLVSKGLVGILLGLFIISLVFSGCGGGDTKPTEPTKSVEAEKKPSEPIKIGLFGPLSGSMSVAGSHQKDGAEYAAEEINSAGGLLGGQIQIIAEDTEGVPQNNVNIMNKFLHKDNVNFTMGSNNSPEVLAVLDIIQKAETPHIVPSGVAYAITHSGNPWVFRVTATDEIFSKALIDYSTKELGFTKFAVIHDTNDYGQGGMKLVVDTIKENGGEAVVVEGYNKGTKDFSPQLLKAKDAQAQAIVIWGNYTEGAQLVRQIKELGIPCEVLVSTGVTIGNFYELAGDAANGIIGVTPGFHLDRTDKLAQDFIKKYESKKGYKPDLNVVMAYDAVNVIAKAVKDANSLDKKAVRDALAKITDFQVISGKVTFNEYGDGGREALIYTVEGGKPKLVN